MSLDLLTEFENYLKSRPSSEGGDLTSGYRVQYNRWQDEPAQNESDTQDTRYMVLKRAGGERPDLDFFSPYVEITLVGKEQENGVDLEQTIDEIMAFMQSSYNSQFYAIIEPIGEPTPVIFTTEERPITSLTVRLINQRNS